MRILACRGSSSKGRRKVFDPERCFLARPRPQLSSECGNEIFSHTTASTKHVKREFREDAGRQDNCKCTGQDAKDRDGEGDEEEDGDSEVGVE
eukprot:747588-Hanusia_phi.AAC.3